MSRGRIDGSAFMQAVGAQFELQEDGHVSAQFVIGEAHQGPPGYAHGGALATLLDEAMGAASWFAGNRTVSVHLSFDYWSPVPVGASITLSAQVERREGRKVFTGGTIWLSDGTVAVSASGVFVDAPQLVSEASGFHLDE